MGICAELYCFAEVGPHLFTYRHILNESPTCTFTHTHTTLWQYECYTESSNAVFRAVTDSLSFLQSAAFINHTHTHALREGEREKKDQKKGKIKTGAQNNRVKVKGNLGKMTGQLRKTDGKRESEKNMNRDGKGERV